MAFLSSWRKLVNRVCGGATASRRRQRTGYRPVFEQFEERLVPTMISIPTTLVGVRGSTVSVPINVSTLYDNSQGEQQQGTFGSEIVVWYNPAFFSVNPSTDIGLGTLINPRCPRYLS